MRPLRDGAMTLLLLISTTGIGIAAPVGVVVFNMRCLWLKDNGFDDKGYCP
jgi:hypothetical protein